MLTQVQQCPDGYVTCPEWFQHGIEGLAELYSEDVHFAREYINGVDSGVIAVVFYLPGWMLPVIRSMEQFSFRTDTWDKVRKLIVQAHRDPLFRDAMCTVNNLSGPPALASFLTASGYRMGI